MQSVGDNISLVDFSSGTGSASATFINDTLTLTSTGTSKYRQYNITDLYKANAGKTLKFIYDSIDVSKQYGTTVVQMRVTDNNEETVGTTMLTHGLTNTPYVIPDDVSNVSAVFLRFWTNSYSSTSYDAELVITKPKLQFGTENEAYSPYNMGVATIVKSNSDNTQSETYSIYTQSPFRSIGEVRDDFVNQAVVWYERHKAKSVILNGTEDWVNAGNFFRLADDMFPQSTGGGVITPSYCNYYLPQTYNDIYNASVDYGFAFSNASHRLVVRNKDFTTKEEFTTWLGTHNIEVVFEASEPTLTECTAEQVEQLEAISQAKSYEGQTNIYSNDVVVPYFECVALKNI